MTLLTEREYNDTHQPDESGLDLWIGRTAISKTSVELYMKGIIHGCSESLEVTLSEEDARDLAHSILYHLDNK